MDLLDLTVTESRRITIREVTLERLNEPNPEIAARIAEGEFRASIATQ